VEGGRQKKNQNIIHIPLFKKSANPFGLFSKTSLTSTNIFQNARQSSQTFLQKSAPLNEPFPE
jgi:hypothetical protein